MQTMSERILNAGVPDALRKLDDLAVHSKSPAIRRMARESADDARRQGAGGGLFSSSARAARAARAARDAEDEAYERVCAEVAELDRKNKRRPEGSPFIRCSATCANGNPCRNNSGTDGLCVRHREVAERRAAEEEKEEKEAVRPAVAKQVKLPIRPIKRPSPAGAGAGTAPEPVPKEEMAAAAAARKKSRAERKAQYAARVAELELEHGRDGAGGAGDGQGVGAL